MALIRPSSPALRVPGFTCSSALCARGWGLAYSLHRDRWWPPTWSCYCCSFCPRSRPSPSPGVPVSPRRGVPFPTLPQSSPNPPSVHPAPGAGLTLREALEACRCLWERSGVSQMLARVRAGCTPAPTRRGPLEAGTIRVASVPSARAPTPCHTCFWPWLCLPMRVRLPNARVPHGCQACLGGPRLLGETEHFCPPAGVWAHGDYCRINPKTGGIVMLGRR